MSYQNRQSGSPNLVITVNLLYSLLRPLQIFLDLLCGLHTICKVHARASQSSLSELLQFEKFAMLGIQLTGSGDWVSFPGDCNGRDLGSRRTSVLALLGCGLVASG